MPSHRPLVVTDRATRKWIAGQTCDTHKPSKQPQKPFTAPQAYYRDLVFALMLLGLSFMLFLSTVNCWTTDRQTCQNILCKWLQAALVFSLSLSRNIIYITYITKQSYRHKNPAETSTLSDFSFSLSLSSLSPSLGLRIRKTTLCSKSFLRTTPYKEHARAGPGAYDSQWLSSSSSSSSQISSILP